MDSVNCHRNTVANLNALKVKSLAGSKEEDNCGYDLPSSPCSVISNVPKFGRVIPNRIFVGGIDIQTSEEDLEIYFSSFGRIIHTKIVRDRADVSKGFGFVTFENMDDAARLKTQADELLLNGKKLNIGPAIEKSQTNIPKDVHLPAPPGSFVLHPGGYTSYTHQNGITYFPPSLRVVAPSPQQQMVAINPASYRESPAPAMPFPGYAIYSASNGQLYSTMPLPQQPNALSANARTGQQLSNPSAITTHQSNLLRLPAPVPQRSTFPNTVQMAQLHGNRQPQMCVPEQLEKPYQPPMQPPQVLLPQAPSYHRPPVSCPPPPGQYFVPAPHPFTYPPPPPFYGPAPGFPPCIPPRNVYGLATHAAYPKMLTSDNPMLTPPSTPEQYIQQQ